MQRLRERAGRLCRQIVHENTGEVGSVGGQHPVRLQQSFPQQMRRVIREEIALQPRLPTDREEEILSIDRIGEPLGHPGKHAPCGLRNGVVPAHVLDNAETVVAGKQLVSAIPAQRHSYMATSEFRNQIGGNRRRVGEGFVKVPHELLRQRDGIGPDNQFVMRGGVLFGGHAGIGSSLYSSSSNPMEKVFTGAEDWRAMEGTTKLESIPPLKNASVERRPSAEAARFHPTARAGFRKPPLRRIRARLRREAHIRRARDIANSARSGERRLRHSSASSPAPVSELRETPCKDREYSSAKNRAAAPLPQFLQVA